VLGTPAKRQAYDRDVMRAPSSDTPRHSYSSSGPVGGRPASGLSRRRTQFRGPPTSFYRSGGWGEHSAKRAAAQQHSAPGSEPRNPSDPGAQEDGLGMGGMGPGQKPWGHGNDVPHFDKEGHFGTQESIDQRRRRRRERAQDGAASEDYGRGRGMGMLGQFVLISGVVGFAVYMPVLVFEMSYKRDRKREK